MKNTTITGTLRLLTAGGGLREPGGPWPLLAISEPDADGEIECVAFAQPDGPGVLPLGGAEIEGGPVTGPLYVRTDKSYLLPLADTRESGGRVTAAFLEKVLRALALEAVRRHAAVAHAAGRPFAPGDRVPYAARVFDEAEVCGLVDASLDFWLTAGRYAKRFEERLALKVGAGFCSLVNSGSSANLLAFMALTSPKLGDRRIRRGDEVITIAAGFPTTVTPVIQFGAVPVFVDVSLPSYNIDCSQLEAALSERTRAVFLPHTLGNPFDAAAVRAFCDRHGLWLIEDNCDSLGSRCLVGGQWRFTGSIGHLGTCSFYPPHHITMGEGGAVLTSDPALHRLVNSFRDWGRDCWCDAGRDDTCKNRFTRQFGELPLGYDHKYVYSHFGYNLKATDMQAAIGCVQLDRLDSFVEKRRANFTRYRAALEPLADLFVLPEETAAAKPGWFGFPVTVRDGGGKVSRDAVVRFLEARNIQTRPLFAGNLLRHPCFDGMRAAGEGFRVAGGLGVTDRIMNDTFWFGVWPGLTDGMAAYVVESLFAAVGRKP